MNHTCTKCGGFIGDFIWSGTSAKVCNCENPNMQNTNTWEKLGAAIAGYSALATRDNYREIIINVEKIEKEAYQRGLGENKLAEQRGIQKCIDEVDIKIGEDSVSDVAVATLEVVKLRLQGLLSSLQDNNKDHV